MDILITLPLDLCKFIMSGHKTIELRSVCPAKFDCERDSVYVVAKGTNNVMLSFTVRNFVRYDDFRECWSACWPHISIPYSWLEQYAKNKRVLFAWEINTVTPIIPYIDAKKRFNIKSNPQSYIYVS